MDADDMDEFAEAWMDCFDLYGKTPSASNIRLAFDALSVYELTEVRRGLTTHVRNPDSGQFPPKPADVIRYLEGTTLTRAGEAWTKVDKAVRHVGPYPDVVFDDPVIHAVLDDMGGWISLCQKTDKEWPFIQREFERRYQGHSGRLRRYPKVLTGIENASNETPLPPRLLGDQQRARLVFDETAKR